MQYVHRWDLGDRGKLYMLTEETTPKGTISLGSGYGGRVTGNPKKVIKVLEGASVSKEIPQEEVELTETITKKATLADLIRKFAQGLEEKK